MNPTEILERLRSHPQRNSFLALGALASVALAFFLFASFFDGATFIAPKANYVPVYTLVNDKVSQHGGIIVNLPKGVSANGAQTKVTFEPALKGRWVSSSLANAIVFKPAAELALGKHYLVSLDTGEGVIKKDFLVDEDPAVIDVFPSGDAEADQSSAITIVFNRPMVPLTTLSELESKSVPVTITPETKGRFKWISTRTLQFIPAGTLAGSAHYAVTIRSEFVSMDGLSIKGKTYEFTTRKLALTQTTADTISYNTPISFRFNQPIDLAKTASTITLTDDMAHRDIPFAASYGEKAVYGADGRTATKVEDRSVLNILPKNSLRGHANVFEFGGRYRATVGTAYPVGGDIVLPGPLMAGVATTPILKDVTAQSNKTNLASPELFDPAGTATFSFYEDINIGKSAIQAHGLKKVAYGEKCAGDNERDYYSPCVKIEDRSTLIMTFNPDAFKRGEAVSVTFEHIVNGGGYQVNEEPVVSTLRVYPELRVMSTLPADNAAGASIKDLILCTNVPLKAKSGKEFYRDVKANKYMVFGRWDAPYLETPDSYPRPPPCAIGEYVNKIYYGLLPRESYTLTASLEDAFGQKTAATLSLKTGNAPKFYLRFQSLQKIYNVTTPEKTKLTFATENFDFVNVSVCKVDPGTMVRYLSEYPKSVTPNSSLDCTSTVTKKVSLKKDQWVNQYFQIDLKDYFPDPRGQFALSFSHPDYEDEQGAPLYARTYLSVTNLAVADKRVRWTSYDYLPDVPNTVDSSIRGLVYWVSRIHSQEPEAGANISVYRSRERYGGGAPILADTGMTNANGFAEFPLIADVAGAAITSGDESAVISQWTDILSSGWQDAYQYERAYLYTDRPIYRPGQEVFVKGLYRLNFDGMFDFTPDDTVKIEIRNSKNDSILTQYLPVSAYGTISTTLKLPSDAPLGTYSIQAGSGYGGYARFDVAEYVGSAFEAKADLDKDEYMAGDTMRARVSGTYYFGVPLDGGTLDYSFSSQNFYFDRYKDEYFNFGGNWYYCYDCGYGDAYIKSGKATLDTSGMATLEQSLDFDELFKDADRDQSKIIVLHGTIKDKQGKSVSFQKSFIVHRGEYYLGVKTDPSFAPAKQPVTLRAKTVNTEGKPVGKSGINIVVNKVTWNYNKREEVDGGFYNRPEKVLTPAITKRVSTNSSGDYSEQITLPDPGEYEISATGKDGRGNDIKSTSYLYLYGEGTVDLFPTNNATLELKAEKTDLSVGGKGRFIIQSPYPHAKALVSLERGRIFTYEVVNVDQNMYEYEFTVTEEHAPNVYASVVLLSPGPEVKFGQLQFTVDRKAKELAIDVRSDKAAYLPGERVTLNITTKDQSGRPAPAEVSVAVADVSVLALKGNPKKNPLLFFYDGFPLAVTTESNIKNLLEETPIPTGTKGGGGGNPEDLATHKRGEFKDTAFWQANVVTNAAGTAQVSFTLPDNLTKWQVESVGITKDTKVGVNYQELTAQKEVMAVPLKPRFVVPGDEFLLGAKIFNRTLVPQTLDIALESSTLEIADGRTRKTIPSGASEAVYFKAKAPEEKAEGAHTFTLSAKNGAYNDTVEQFIPITRNTTYEYTATSNATSASHAEEYLYLPDGLLKDRGGVTVKTSATLAVYLSDALRYLFQYPYGCSEQLASRLSAMAITKRALAVPNVAEQFAFPTVLFDGTEYTVDEAVAKGLDQLYASQDKSGGFSYYQGLAPNPYLTMHVLNALQDLKEAGYRVRQDVVALGAEYLSERMLQREDAFFKKFSADTDTLILAAYTLSRVAPDSASYPKVVNMVTGLANQRYLTDSASTGALGYLALLAAHGGTSKSFKETVYATLVNRVDIDSRGAYAKPNPKNIGWSYYETPEKDTALFLKALVADKREYSQTDKILRWILASRAADGSWGSTNTTVAAIDALSDYLVWKRETESDFALTTALDGGTVSATTFDKKNILSIVETFIPISKIDAGKNHALTFAKKDNTAHANTFYYDLSLKYFLPVKDIAPRDEGVAVTREFYALTDQKSAHPLSSVKSGTVVRGVLTVISPKQRHLFAIEDYIPAGFELVDFTLATEDKAQTEAGVETKGGKQGMSAAAVPSDGPGKPSLSGYFANALAGLFGAADDADESGNPVTYQEFRPDFKELHDDRLFLFAENVAPGAYSYSYYVRATTPGTFSHLPAVASDLYFPENFGRTAGSLFTVEP